MPLREAPFEDLLSELEAVTTEMLAADPHELTLLASLMERRQEAATAVASRLSGAAQPAAIERARQIRDQGAEIEERLRLVRASARRQLQELYRTSFCMRAMATENGAGQSSLLNIEA